jgi:hypothetical protein
MSPPAAKLAAINPVAVLLCKIAVTPTPARNARNRSPTARANTRRRLGPKERWMPLWTMWTPQSNSAIAPARSISVRVAPTVPPMGGRLRMRMNAAQVEKFKLYRPSPTAPGSGQPLDQLVSPGGHTRRGRRVPI